MNRPNIMQRINARLKAHANGERGLALLDVLLGMAIFALIVVIGIQSFSKFRERAAVTQVSSDAKQVATGLEALLTEPGKTTTDIPTGELDAGQLVDLGVRLTTGSRATVQRTGDTFDACVENDKAYAWYRGAAGAILDTGSDGTCASTAANGVTAPGGAVPPVPEDNPEAVNPFRVTAQTPAVGEVLASMAAAVVEFNEELDDAEDLVVTVNGEQISNFGSNTAPIAGGGQFTIFRLGGWGSGSTVNIKLIGLRSVNGHLLDHELTFTAS